MAFQSTVPEVTMSSGQKMPVLGLGTAPFPPVASEIVVQAVVQAIELGYRHFDTASVYQTESTLGDAIQEAIRVGLIKSREEVFLTSKLWCSDAHPHLVAPALQTALRISDLNVALQRHEVPLVEGFDVEGSSEVGVHPKLHYHCAIVVILQFAINWIRHFMKPHSYFL